MQDEGLIFALDKNFNLVRIDINMLNKGKAALYNFVNFKSHGNTVLYVGENRLWLLHASGVTQKIMKLPFKGKL